MIRGDPPAALTFAQLNKPSGNERYSNSNQEIRQDDKGRKNRDRSEDVFIRNLLPDEVDRPRANQACYGCDSALDVIKITTFHASFQARQVYFTFLNAILAQVKVSLLAVCLYEFLGHLHLPLPNFDLLRGELPGLETERMFL